MKIRITKEFDFEAAHALDGYNGKCKDIHGHSYHLEMTFIGTPKSDLGLSDCGMVVDFGDIKKLVNTYIISNLDHTLMLPGTLSELGIDHQKPMFERLMMVNFQPSCENLLIYISEELKKVLPPWVVGRFLSMANELKPNIEVIK